MQHIFFFTVLISVIASCDITYAQAATEITAPGAVTTTTTTTTVNAPIGTPVITDLKDGTKIEVYPDGAVFVVYTDGTKVAAPDGTHTLNDGTTLTVKGGRTTPIE